MQHCECQITKLVLSDNTTANPQTHLVDVKGHALNRSHEPSFHDAEADDAAEEHVPAAMQTQAHGDAGSWRAPVTPASAAWHARHVSREVPHHIVSVTGNGNPLYASTYLRASTRHQYVSSSIHAGQVPASGRARNDIRSCCRSTHLLYRITVAESAIHSTT